MIYGTENYAERERAAWQAGNYELAEVLAICADRDEELAEHEKQLEEQFEAGRREGAEEGFDAYKVKAMDALDALSREIDTAKRIGSRKAIDAALTALYDALA